MYGYCQEKTDTGHSAFQGIRIIYIAQEPLEWKCCRMGPMVFRLYPRRLKDLTTCRDETIKQYLLLSYLNTLRVGLAEIDLLLWILVLNFLHKPGAAVIQKVGPGEWDDRWTCMVLLAVSVSSSSSLFFLTNTITVQMTDLLRNWQWWIWEIHLKQRNNITQLLYYGYKGTHTLISC